MTSKSSSRFLSKMTMENEHKIKQVPRNFVAEPFPYHHELDLQIESLTNLGVGLARVDGWVVMVPFCLPGERVRARVFRNHKNYSEADLVEVLEASPERGEPQCPLFGTCGGCQYQHLHYETQKDWKRKQVQELMERIGGLDIRVLPTHGSPRQYHYRSKLTPHWPRRTPGDFPIGFHYVSSRKSVVDVPQCAIATEAINEALPAARKFVRDPKKKSKKGGTLLLRHTLEGVTHDHGQVVSEKVGDLVLQFHAGDFFQNNPFILPELVSTVIGHATKGGQRYLVDAYCGTGLFALAAARHFEAVAGVEINERSIQWARANAIANGLRNTEFLAGKAEEIFAGIRFSGEESTLIIDPPRSGCDEAFLRQLLDFAPARLVYVSCDPSTQARDLKYLTSNGFALQSIEPFDLFPQTRHIESVAVLNKS